MLISPVQAAGKASQVSPTRLGLSLRSKLSWVLTSPSAKPRLVGRDDLLSGQVFKHVSLGLRVDARLLVFLECGGVQVLEDDDRNPCEEHPQTHIRLGMMSGNSPKSAAPTRKAQDSLSYIPEPTSCNNGSRMETPDATKWHRTNEENCN